MFEKFKVRKNSKQMSVEEIIDKYIKTNFVTIDVNSKGEVKSVWIGTERNR